MRIRSYFDATMLIYRHFVHGIFIHTQAVHYRNLCKTENGDVRRRRGAQISYSSFFQSGLTPIDTYCQIKST